MYDDIGDKIKAAAVIGCILEIIACVIVGIHLISESTYRNPTDTIGWGIMIGGSLAAWVGSFCLYGFGELIEKTCANNDSLIKMEKELTDLKKAYCAEEDKSGSVSSVISSEENNSPREKVQLEPMVVDKDVDLFNKKQVYTNKPLQTLVDAPIRIEEVSLLSDVNNNGNWGNIRFFNQSKQDIIAILVRLEAYNIAGEKVHLEKNRFIYQNIIVPSGEEYGNQVSFALPSVIRSINVILDKVVFANNDVWNAQNANTCSPQAPVEFVIPETYFNQIMDKISEQSVNTNYIRYQYTEGRGYWQCTCGRVNGVAHSQCGFCENGKSQRKVLTQQSVDSMVQTIEAEIAEQKRKEEQARLVEQARLAEKARLEEQMRRMDQTRKEEKTNQEKNDQTVIQKGFDYPYPLKHYNGVCPNCGLKHYNDRSSCVRCGSRFAPEDSLDSLFEIPVYCPKCGKKLSEGVKFCYSCGAKVE